MMRKVVMSCLAGIGLLCCLASPLLYFLGKIDEKDYKGFFLVASLSWFLFASLLALIKKIGQRPDGNHGKDQSPISSK